MTQDMTLWGDAPLYPLLAKQAIRYTQGDSSSLPVETVGQLLRSIRFTFALWGEMPAPGQPLEAAFALAQQAVLAAVDAGRGELDTLKATPPPVTSRAYMDTLTALTDFYAHYDARFHAHGVPCLIDYQLAMPVKETEGITYIRAYQAALLMENRFLRRFAPNRLNALLASALPDYTELVANLMEPVLVNALGLVLLGADPTLLDISGEACDALWQRLHLPGVDIEATVQAAVARLCGDDDGLAAYLSACAKGLTKRLAVMKDSSEMRGVFTAIRIPARESAVYVDAPTMPDEALRALVAELSSCRYVSDKVAMMRREVHSARDAIEVLRAGFFGEEAFAYLDTLAEAELAILAHYDPDGAVLGPYFAR